MTTFFTLDLQGTLTYVNANNASHHLHLTEGQNIWSDHPEEINTVFHRACRRAMEDHQTVLMETFYASNESWWERHVYPIPGGLAVYCKDITEIKKKEDALRASQANLDAILNNTEVLMWSLDTDLKFLSFNKAFVDYMKTHYGINPRHQESFIRDTLALPNSYYENWVKIYYRVLTGESMVFENSRFGQDFQYSLSPIMENSQIIGIGAFACNITQNRKQEFELAQATRRIEDLKRASLRSAMDSHFIFSTLNSIQDYIIDHDRESAVNYLASFSKLIRNVLNSTLSDQATLADEIDMVTNYVKLEQMRRGDLFDFELSVAPEVDLGIEVPPMIVQPFVENAIVHGFKGMTGAGKIVLSISLHEGQLLITIDDNGVGRAATSAEQRKNHRSLSTWITEERLHLMSAGHSISLSIMDKEHGTKIMLTVPLEVNQRGDEARVKA